MSPYAFDQYFKLGILDFDFTFIVFLIFAIINFAIMNIIPFAVALVSKSNPTAGAAIGGFTEAFAPLYNGYVIAEGATEAVYDQTQLLNQGNLIYVIVLGVLVVIRFIYRLLVRLLSKKVRKTYLKTKKQMKADRKALQNAQ